MLENLTNEQLISALQEKLLESSTVQTSSDVAIYNWWYIALTPYRQEFIKRSIQNDYNHCIEQCDACNVQGLRFLERKYNYYAQALYDTATCKNSSLILSMRRIIGWYCEDTYNTTNAKAAYDECYAEISKRGLLTQYNKLLLDMKAFILKAKEKIHGEFEIKLKLKSPRTIKNHALYNNTEHIFYPNCIIKSIQVEKIVIFKDGRFSNDLQTPSDNNEIYFMLNAELIKTASGSKSTRYAVKSKPGMQPEELEYFIIKLNGKNYTIMNGTDSNSNLSIIDATVISQCIKSFMANS